MFSGQGKLSPRERKVFSVRGKFLLTRRKSFWLRGKFLLTRGKSLAQRKVSPDEGESPLVEGKVIPDGVNVLSAAKLPLASASGSRPNPHPALAEFQISGGKLLANSAKSRFLFD